MPSSLNGTGVTFNDGTQLNSANDAGGNYIMRTYNATATWTKPAGLKAVRVTVVGAGGNSSPAGGPTGANPQRRGAGGGGGSAIRYLPAPSIPGPVTATVGTAPAKTSSFGAFVSATGGANGGPFTSPGPGGVGVGGDLNIAGEGGSNDSPISLSFRGGNSYLGFGGQGVGGLLTAGNPGRLYGGGASGAFKSGPAPNPPSIPGGTGANGVVIVEEFY